MKSRLALGGYFRSWWFDKHGRLVSYDRTPTHNLIVNEAFDPVLDYIVHGATQVDPWYVGLKSTGAVDATDTLATPINWTEITDYTGDRKEYDEAAASGGSIDNSASPATFVFDGVTTIYGAFLCSVSTGTAGIILAVGDFSSAKGPVGIGDYLYVTYTLTIADDGV